MLEPLMQGLGAAGNALSAPRRALWTALGGPEHGNELVSGWTGLDKDSPWAHALGFGAEVAGDPLTWAMVGAGGLGANALRQGASAVAKAPSAMPGLARVAAPGLEAAAAEGAGQAGGGLSKLLGLRRGFTAVRDVTPLAGEDLAAVRQFADAGQMPRRMAFFDPGGETAFLGKTVNSAGQDPSRLLTRAMAGQDIAPTTTGMFDTAGKTAFQMRPAGEQELLKELAAQGNTAAVANVKKAAGRMGNTIRRHEGFHGLVNEAAAGGDASGLGPVGKLSAWLQRPVVQSGAADAQTFRQGMGVLTDELGAHMAEGRGLAGQLGKGAKFLFRSPGELISPGAGRQYYSAAIRARSPWAGALYDLAGVSPYMAGAGVPAAGAVGYFAQE